MRYRLFGICIAALVPVSSPASAQSDGLFAGFLTIFGIRLPLSVSTRSSGAAPTSTTPGSSITIAPNQFSDGLSVAVAYCVRLCDGSYFPLPLSQGSPHETPTKICKALCPASGTRIYVGTIIDSAYSADGFRYASLDTAFTYREALVAGCTCNGKDAFGTAPVDITEDPTLRAGDIVVTREGLRVFTGSIRNVHRAHDFSPVENDSKLSASLRTAIRW